MGIQITTGPHQHVGHTTWATEGSMSLELPSVLDWDAGSGDKGMFTPGPMSPGLSRSSVATLKRKTPSIDPWGAHPCTGQGSDHDSPTHTVINLLERKVANNSNIGVLAPFLAEPLRQC